MQLYIIYTPFINYNLYQKIGFWQVEIKTTFQIKQFQRLHTMQPAYNFSFTFNLMSKTVLMLLSIFVFLDKK